MCVNFEDRPRVAGEMIESKNDFASKLRERYANGEKIYLQLQATRKQMKDIGKRETLEQRNEYRNLGNKYRHLNGKSDYKYYKHESKRRKQCLEEVPKKFFEKDGFRYFDGKNGVYYHPLIDALILLSNRHPEERHFKYKDGADYTSTVLPTFSYHSQYGFRDNAKLIGDEDLIYLGGLDD